MTGKSRQMIYAPEINPDTFLFFFQKGDVRNSWSIRDYSVPNRPVGARYAHQFSVSLDDLWSKVVQNFDAPTHPTTDLGFWHRHTRDLNRTYLGKHPDASAPTATSYISATTPVLTNGELRAPYPILDRDRFDRHRKSRKPQDRERMLNSNASEDWVTWTVFRLLERYAPTTWWPDLVELAKDENPRLSLPSDWQETPEISLWECVASPRSYEKASRERMRRSNNSAWAARSYDPKPVEGESEIDIILRNRALVVFAEAKLGSDVSPSTTYDPHRNQIVRNIDCVLDRADDRVPIFWMVVRDAGQKRSYTQLLNAYRSQPEALVGELPHHDAQRVIALAGNLSLILWWDLVVEITRVVPGDDAEIVSIKSELRRRL